MKFTCSQSVLLKAVNMVSKAVSAKTTVPALKGILLQVKDNELVLTGSDLDFSVITRIDVVEAEEGSIIVSAKLFSEIIRKLPNAMVRAFSDEKNRLSISCLDSNFNIVGAPSDEYPSVGVVSSTESVELNNKAFRNLIGRTSFAASIDEKKGVLVGCLVKISGGFIEMVSLDGFRMAVAKEETGNSENVSIIVPAKILNEISKLLSEQEAAENIKLDIEERKIQISAGDVRMISRLLDGEFIRYNDILPKMYKTRIIVSREELQSSVERASLFVIEGKNNLIKLKIDGNGIEITSRNDSGNVNDIVSAELEGDPIEIGFNSKYMMDVLKVVGEEEIALEMTNSLSACMIKQVDGDSYQYLVLPVRLSI